MTFKDIFKSSFLENVTAVSILDIVLALVLAFCLGLLIFYIYKKTYSGVMYSSSFGVTLVSLTMITTLVILAVTSNVVLSLGMVGALSIVRAGMIPLAVFGSVLIGAVILIFANHRDMSNPYIVVLRTNGHESETKAVEFLKSHVKKCVIKSKTAQKDSVELNLEVRLQDENTDFINELTDVAGVESAVLVSYNGDYMG